MPRRARACVTTPNGESRRTSVQSLLQFDNLTHRPANTVDALRREAILLNCLAAFHHDGRYVDIVACHLLRQVDAEGRPATVRRNLCGRVARRRCVRSERGDRWKLERVVVRTIRGSTVHGRHTKPSSRGPSRRGPLLLLLPRARA